MPCRCRKGEFGLYDCREKTDLVKIFLVFFLGFVTGFFCVIWALT